MKVKLGINVMKLVESLIGSDVTVGQGSETTSTYKLKNKKQNRIKLTKHNIISKTILVCIKTYAIDEKHTIEHDYFSTGIQSIMQLPFS